MTVRKVTKQKGEATRRYQVILLLFFFRLADLLCLLIAVYSFLNLLCIFFLYSLTPFFNKGKTLLHMQKNTFAYERTQNGKQTISS